jgi:RES domain-containing protein
LLKAVRACAHLATTWRGEAYRAVTVPRANEADLLSGEGSRLWGQRWNPPGLFRAVYLSLEMSTALEESLAQNRRLGLPDAEGLPLVIAATRAIIPRLLDLTLGRVRSILRVSETRMVSEPHDPGPESITQAIGRIAHSEDLQGLLVPSAAVPGAKNLVVFPDRLPPGHLVPVNPGRLPPKAGGH